MLGSVLPLILNAVLPVGTVSTTFTSSGFSPAILGDFSTPVFETRTVAGSEPLSLLTCPHTAIFTLLSIFSSLEMRSTKNLGDNTVLACEIFSSDCRPRLKNARAKAPYYLEI